MPSHASLLQHGARGRTLPPGSALAGPVSPRSLHFPGALVSSGGLGECRVRAPARAQLPHLRPPPRLRPCFLASRPAQAQGGDGPGKTEVWARRAGDGAGGGGGAAGGRALPPAQTGRHAQVPRSAIGLPCSVTCCGDARRACVTVTGGFLPPLIPWRRARLRELVQTEGLCPVQGRRPSRSPSKDLLRWDIPARSPCVSFLVPGTDD